MLIVYIHNITNCSEISDYEYAVNVNETRIASGKIKRFRRARGWHQLVMKIVRQELKKRSQEKQAQ